MSHPHTLCIGASRWRKHSLCREEKEGRGRRWEGGSEGRSEEEEQGRMEKGAERVKIVEGRDANAS